MISKVSKQPRDNEASQTELNYFINSIILLIQWYSLADCDKRHAGFLSFFVEHVYCLYKVLFAEKRLFYDKKIK